LWVFSIIRTALPVHWSADTVAGAPLGLLVQRGDDVRWSHRRRLVVGRHLVWVQPRSTRLVCDSRPPIVKKRASRAIVSNATSSPSAATTRLHRSVDRRWRGGRCGRRFRCRLVDDRVSPRGPSLPSSVAYRGTQQLLQCAILEMRWLGIRIPRKSRAHHSSHPDGDFEVVGCPSGKSPSRPGSARRA